MARELMAGAELAELLADPVYYGAGVPRADGRAAVVLPGMFANDWYLQPLHNWLRRAGFRSVRSTLRMNVGCPERLTRQIEDALDARRRNDAPVVLIGHSRGGILARAMAARLQDEASHLILLGSPVGGILRSSWAAAGRSGLARPSVERAGRAAREALDPDCNVPQCGCPFPDDLRQKLSPKTRVVSIYSRDDPVVPAGACRVAGAENIEVSGTHSGLVYNRAVYRELARVLKD